METKYRTKEDVHNRAKEIVGIPFKDLLQTNKTSTKNFVGDLFEQWFGKVKDSDSKPDLGIVELKATPYKQLKNGKYSSKERLVLNIINYMDLVHEDFENSHFLEKNSTIELGFYQYLVDKPKDDWTFSDVALYEMRKNPIDYAIIENDWKTIQKYVLDGHAELLSESLTDYLSACTKGAGKGKGLRQQPYSDVKAKQRAFSLKNGYMTQMLQNYILGNKQSDSLITSKDDLQENSLQQIITKRLNKYVGWTKEDLKSEFNISTNAYHLNELLIRGMLGLDNKNKKDPLNIDEIQKAMYYFKTVQFDKKGVNKENMSFPAFEFKDICKETWLDSDGYPSADLNLMFSEGTLIICVFQINGSGKNIFKGFKFYNVPQSDIDNEIKECWEQTVKVLQGGVHLEYTGSVVENNLPKKTENRVIHVRPHASKSAYVKSGYSNQLPVPAKWINKPEGYSDDYMTNQCFFLNNTYVKKAVEDLLN